MTPPRAPADAGADAGAGLRLSLRASGPAAAAPVVPGCALPALVALRRLVR